MPVQGIAERAGSRLAGSGPGERGGQDGKGLRGARAGVRRQVRPLDVGVGDGVLVPGSWYRVRDGPQEWLASGRVELQALARGPDPSSSR